MPFVTFSTVCSTERRLPWIGAAVWLVAASAAPAAAEASRVAIFPPVDRTGRSAPLEQVHAALEGSLAAGGFDLLPRADLETFLRRHRIRNTAGISGETARAIGEEMDVDGILLTSVDDWETVEPPRFAITSRWIAATPAASLVWMETSAHHGEERPGAFGLGLVLEAEILIERGVGEIAASLAAPGPPAPPAAPRRFRPGSVAVDPVWAASATSVRPPRVAVLPFVVDEERRDVGEILASQFMRWLLATGRMEVLEPGVVREALLEARVIQEGGPSLPQVDALRALLDVDLIVSGHVTDHEALGSAPGSPFLGFSARAIDTATRQVVWSSFSFGRGDDRIGLFGTARIRSSLTLASGLVRGAVEALDEALDRETRRRAPRGLPAVREDGP